MFVLVSNAVWMSANSWADADVAVLVDDSGEFGWVFAALVLGRLLSVNVILWISADTAWYAASKDEFETEVEFDELLSITTIILLLLLSCYSAEY